MLGSIYVGLSGLDAYSRGLKQVSNNVTNLNSQGYKASTVSFRDVTGTRGSGGATYASEGGSSAHGVSYGETRLSFAQGELRQTDRDLDLSVNGSGFLMLMRGSEVAYTRTGSFEVDRDGYIVLAGTDYRLATLDGAGNPVSLSIDASSSSAPKATSAVTFADNLSSSATTFSVNNIKVLDKTGAEHVWQAQFARDTTVAGQWTVTVTDSTGRTIGTQTLKFINGVADPTASKLSFTNADADLAVSLDFTRVTAFSSGDVSTLRAASVDGHKLGTIASVAVNETGAIEIAYTNGQKKALGAIAIADFRDPQSLKQQGGGLFTAGAGAGRQLLTSEDGRAGSVMSRRLEASNVDLSKEFGDLILIQRGFQASSQIISVANDMIQQLFGIRGQG